MFVIMWSMILCPFLVDKLCREKGGSFQEFLGTIFGDLMGRLH